MNGLMGVITLLAVTVCAAEVDSAELRQLRERWSREPTIGVLQVAAARYAGVHPELLHQWRQRVRQAPWWPVMRAEYRHVVTDDQRWRTGSGDEPSRQYDAGIQLRPAVGVQWELDRLVFDPLELRVAAQGVDLIRMREILIERVTRAYFDRRRLQLMLLLEPPETALERSTVELKILEAEAALDGWTDGGFLRAGTGGGR